MKNLFVFFLVGLFFSAFNASANTEIVFQCMTKNKKTIKIERVNDTLKYTYGNERKNDLTLESPLYSKEFSGIFSPDVQLGNKSGPYFFNTITFHNGEYNYSVIALSDINVPSDTTFTGVEISGKNMKTKEIKCLEESIQDNFESLFSYDRSRNK
ncbi:hypothetical protein PT300_14680 [Enterobacteriaceae bacterium ESL0689]|nr:hypothetical protein [Enterobacteriaceae bacterium ESL0689]